ncbi:T9SS type A sorting domain-containing protein [Mariniflexile sp.]|uniref:T9SS type A sorting domain-containing protein n=1 Tax=Mariniflexile sp. TaxID=1979402 RepID=UPI004048432F
MQTTIFKQNSFRKAIISLLLVLSGYTLQAQVLWYGDPNQPVSSVFYRFDTTGNTNPTGSQCVDDPGSPPVVTTPTDPDYGKFWRITKPTSRKRAEFARTNGLIPQQGETYYLAWRWRINSTPSPTGDITVFQWKTDQGSSIDTNKQNYPFNMEYDGTALTLNAFGPAEPNWNRPGSITKRKTTIWESAVAENTWVSFVIKIKVDDTYDSTNNRHNGYIEFWFNGVQQTLTNTSFQDYQVVLDQNNTRAYHRTNDGVQVYAKWGAYNENACYLETLTDYNEMRVASTYQEALSSQKAIKHEINTYFNPKDDILYFTNANNILTKVKVFDITGKHIHTYQIDMNNDVIQLNLSELENGIYILKLMGDQINQTQKIIKY